MLFFVLFLEKGTHPGRSSLRQKGEQPKYWKILHKLSIKASKTSLNVYTRGNHRF